MREEMMVHLSRRTVLLAGVAWAVTELGPNNVHAQNSTRPSLPIPAELRADGGGTIRLDARPGSMRFVGDRETATYGINGPYLGPAVRVRRGQKVVAQVSNNVPETITMHWHGLIIPGAADGGPHQVIPPGKQWQTELAIDQPAATLWFHPHSYPATTQEVIRGLAGLLIIDDEESSRLPLPSLSRNWQRWPRGILRTHAAWAELGDRQGGARDKHCSPRKLNHHVLPDLGAYAQSVERCPTAVEVS